MDVNEWFRIVKQIEQHLMDSRVEMVVLYAGYWEPDEVLAVQTYLNKRHPTVHFHVRFPSLSYSNYSIVAMPNPSHLN